MTLNDFISKLRLAHDVPNYYNNKFPYNCGYYDGQRYSWDCWNLIKTILAIPSWEDTKVKGSYVSPKNFVTGDCDGYHLLLQCTNRSKDFTQLKQPGTYLYLSTSPHAGVYLGDFEYNGHIVNVVECTGAWESKVQYTYVDEKGGRYLYKGGPKNKYSWTDYGLLPWVDYNAVPVSPVAYGVDVSRWQKGFDLNYAIAEGFNYAIIKAGGADAGYYKDSQFENFYNQALNDKMYIGAYYFGCAFSVEDAVREANYFISYLQGKRIVHVYYDVEGKMLNQGYQHLTDIITAFCSTMIQAGYACGIYTSESHFNSRFNDNAVAVFPHWVAKYSKNPPVLKSIAPIEIWQFGGSTNYCRSPQIHGTTVDQDQINIQWVDSGSIPEAKEVTISEPTVKTTDQVAIEVLAGLWGNGVTRKAKLTLAGYDYKEVQDKVNMIIASRSNKRKPHIVAKGETLSGIAKRYGTTYKKLAEINGIPKPYTIYPNQEIYIA